MITTTTKQTIERQGVQSEGQFRIKATGKAFRILSDGLYSDKIMAIIRELSCNAYDAHVEAGTVNKPFVINLPNQLQPTFSIRDFGVGLSHDDIVQVYTTYFESTKTDSNDYVGCLGLGSKSPFSYVDNFTIVSYYDGEKRTYSAFMNEEGLPTIALLTTDKSTEPNGIEISFPVNVHDFNSFYQRMGSVFRYFKLQPVVKGVTEDVAKIVPVEYTLKGDGWGLRKEQQGYNQHARAIMGNVSYPLRGIDKDKLSELELSVLDSAVDIEFPIGELEVSASRESLSFNKRTFAAVRNRMNLAAEGLAEKIVKDLENAPTLWDARLKAVELSDNQYNKLRPIFRDKMRTYKGQEIKGSLASTTVAIPNEDIGEHLTITCFEEKGRRRRRYSYGTEAMVVKNHITTGIRAIKGIRFYVKDLNIGSHIRCKQVLTGDDAISKVYLIEEHQTGAIKAMLEFLGMELDVPAVSTIERIKDKSSGGDYDYNPKNAKRLLTYERDEDQHEYRNPSSWWRSEKLRVSHGGMYVNIERWKINGINDAPHYMRSHFKALEAVGIDTSNMQVIGAKNSVIDKVRDDSRWVNFHDYVVKAVRDHASGLTELMVKAKGMQKLRANDYKVSWFSDLKLDVADKTSAMGAWLEKSKEANDAASLVEDISEAMNHIGMGVSSMELTEEVDAYRKELQGLVNAVGKAYPLVSHLAQSYLKESAKADLTAYIDMKDREAKAVVPATSNAAVKKVA